MITFSSKITNGFTQFYFSFSRRHSIRICFTPLSPTKQTDTTWRCTYLKAKFCPHCQSKQHVTVVGVPESQFQQVLNFIQPSITQQLQNRGSGVYHPGQNIRIFMVQTWRDLNQTYSYMFFIAPIWGFWPMIPAHVRLGLSRTPQVGVRGTGPT